MPLNSHSYLVGQGWQGTGEALREGAVSRPVVVAQKKSLAGVGKDRDEAYPFWDHVFAAAATSIKVKLYNGDDDEDTDVPQPSGSSTPLDRTSTGIISNKPQKIGLSALETPDAAKSTRMSVMAIAKRESARRGLYSRFFRGPVLGPDTEESRALELNERSPPSRSGPNDPRSSVTIAEQRKGKKRRFLGEDEEIEVAQKKKNPKRENETKEERKERRKLKRLKKEVGKGKVSEVRLDYEDEGALAMMSAVLESSAKKDHQKKKKRKDRESSVRHDG